MKKKVSLDKLLVSLFFLFSSLLFSSLLFSSLLFSSLLFSSLLFSSLLFSSLLFSSLLFSSLLFSSLLFYSLLFYPLSPITHNLTLLSSLSYHTHTHSHTHTHTHTHTRTHTHTYTHRHTHTHKHTHTHAHTHTHTHTLTHLNQPPSYTPKATQTTCPSPQIPSCFTSYHELEAEIDSKTLHFELCALPYMTACAVANPYVSLLPVPDPIYAGKVRPLGVG
jgi:hypothetical protein